MKHQEVNLFEKTTAQLDGLYQELSILAKKSPNDAVSKFKLKYINDVLHQCNSLLGEAYRPFGDFESFSLDDMPTNSDATFILSQYRECAEKLRSDHIVREGPWWYWKVDDFRGELRTFPPKRLID